MEPLDAAPNAVLRLVRRAGLEVPALLALELAWPLRFFLRQGFCVAAPLFGEWGAEGPLMRALDDPAAWERWRHALAAPGEAP